MLGLHDALVYYSAREPNRAGSYLGSAMALAILSSLPFTLVGYLCRRLALPQRIGNWSLTSLQQRLVKTGGRLIKHARYYWLLAESHLTWRLFAGMLGRTDGLSLPSGSPGLRHPRK